MSIIKTMTIDGFYTPQMAINISKAIGSLSFDDYEFGTQIKDFNMVSDDMDEMFSNVLNFNVEVDKESGFFRYPKLFIHFEYFSSPQDWLFIVALEPSTFNIFEHQSGAKNALQKQQLNYRNLFEWDLKVNHLLDPGQGVFFRPWLFHAFDGGLIQVYRVKELEKQQNVFEDK